MLGHTVLVGRLQQVTVAQPGHVRSGHAFVRIALPGSRPKIFPRTEGWQNGRTGETVRELQRRVIPFLNQIAGRGGCSLRQRARREGAAEHPDGEPLAVHLRGAEREPLARCAAGLFDRSEIQREAFD